MRLNERCVAEFSTSSAPTDILASWIRRVSWTEAISGVGLFWRIIFCFTSRNDLTRNPSEWLYWTMPCAELAESGEPYAFQITFAIRRAWSSSRSTNCEKIRAARCPGIGRLSRASLYVNPFDPTAVFCRIRSAGPNVGKKGRTFTTSIPDSLPFYLVKERLGLRLFPTVNPAAMLDAKKKNICNGRHTV